MENTISQNHKTAGSSLWAFAPLCLCASFFIFGLSCARQGFPPGGPKDVTPAALASSIPAPLSKNVSATEPVVIEFTKAMDEKSVADNLFIVPIPAQWPELRWKSGSRVLTLRFPKPLRDNTTYVITVGSKASDTRTNQLKDSISLKFSTGEVIENGEIRGKVVPFHFFAARPENVPGVDIVAYILADSTARPDPRNDVPDYMTQTNADGSYTLVGLSSSTYRLFAIGDKDRDGFYSEGYDMIGLASHDVTFAKGDTLALAPQTAISEKDTSQVQLRSIRPVDLQRVEFFFDKDIDPGSVELSIEGGIDILGWFILAGDLKRISVATSEQKNGKEYTVKSLQVKSSDGYPLLPMEKRPVFTGTDRPDTTALEILEWGPKLLTPGKDPVQLVFNRVLALPDSIRNVIADSSGVNPAVKKTGPNMLELFPASSWKENFNYLFMFNRENLRGAAGNRLTGPGAQIAFRVVPSDTLGFIEGTIGDKTGTPQSLYRLMFRNLDANTRKTLEIMGQAAWTAGMMIPGRYVAAGFRDDTANGVFTRGTVSPYRVSEPVYVYPDTITVVSRRTTGNINFIFQ